MTKIMAILNLTPDSFSDGGIYNNKKEAIKRVQDIIKQGANIIDIGAESTRPVMNKIHSLSQEEEWERLKNILPEIITLAKSANIKTSIDTKHYETASKAVDLGIDIINSVDGCNDINLQNLIAQNNLDVIIMHQLSLPADPNNIIDLNLDVVSVVKNWAINKIIEMEDRNIKKNKIIFDPGIGFGKNAQQSIKLIMSINDFKDLNVRLLYGHSRKTYLSICTDKDFKDRDIETYAITAYLAMNSIDYLRVHDIEGNYRIIKTIVNTNCHF